MRSQWELSAARILRSQISEEVKLMLPSGYNNKNRAALTGRYKGVLTMNPVEEDGSEPVKALEVILIDKPKGDTLFTLALEPTEELIKQVTKDDYLLLHSDCDVKYYRDREPFLSIFPKAVNKVKEWDYDTWVTGYVTITAGKDIWTFSATPINESLGIYHNSDGVESSMPDYVIPNFFGESRTETDSTQGQLDFFNTLVDNIKSGDLALEGTNVDDIALALSNDATKVVYIVRLCCPDYDHLKTVEEFDYKTDRLKLINEGPLFGEDPIAIFGCDFEHIIGISFLRFSMYLDDLGEGYLERTVLKYCNREYGNR